MKQIVIEVYETGIAGQVGIQTRKEGMDAEGWDVVHHYMTEALHQVAMTYANEVAAEMQRELAGRIQVPGFVVNGGRA